MSGSAPSLSTTSAILAPMIRGFSNEARACDSRVRKSSLPIESEAERGVEDGAGIEGKDRAIQSDILDALAGAIRADVVTRGTASRAAFVRLRDKRGSANRRSPIAIFNEAAGGGSGIGATGSSAVALVTSSDCDAASARIALPIKSAQITAAPTERCRPKSQSGSAG